jgi:luciferase-like monooxygenase
MTTASEQITHEVTSWPGVEAAPGDRGSSVAFKLGRRELGHLHGDRSLHLGFPKADWHRLYDEGRIDYHPVFPGKPGFAARALDSDDDVLDAIALLRINYERARRAEDRRRDPAAGARG